MRTCSILFCVALTFAMVGCQAPNKSSQPLHDEYTYTQTHSAEISDMPKVISNVCVELGVKIEDSIEEEEQYKALCKSMTGLDVRFEAMPYVPGKLVVMFTIQGDKRFIGPLKMEIGNALRREIRLLTKGN
jgi:hypothetical protein